MPDDDFTKLRDRTEIQRAHDILSAIVTEEVPHPSPANPLPFICALDVLCWVLKHDHNQTFASNLEFIDKAMKESGFVLRFEPDGVRKPEDVKEGA